MRKKLKKKHKNKPLSQNTTQNVQKTQESYKEESKTYEARVFISTIDPDLLAIYHELFAKLSSAPEALPLQSFAAKIILANGKTGEFEDKKKITSICQRFIRETLPEEGSDTKGAESRDWNAEFFALLHHKTDEISHVLLGSDELKRTQKSLNLWAELYEASANLLMPNLEGLAKKQADPVSQEILDFLAFRSCPDPGYDLKILYSVKTTLLKEPLINSPHIAYAEQAHGKAMFQKFHEKLENLLLIDEIYSQHSKLYEELCTAFALDEELPAEMLTMLRKRIGRTPAYLDIKNFITHSIDKSPNIPRKSRLNNKVLLLYRGLYGVLQSASENDYGICAMLV
ncbi:MAG: hypothetical protein WC966_03515 [Bradymonadales bacterium]